MDTVGVPAAREAKGLIWGELFMHNSIHHSIYIHFIISTASVSFRLLAGNNTRCLTLTGTDNHERMFRRGSASIML